MRTRVRFAIFALLAVIAAPTFAAGQADQPAATEQEDPERNGFRWRNRPTFQFGELRVDIRFKTQLDWRTFDPEIGETTFDRRQVRGGINAEYRQPLRVSARTRLVRRRDPLRVELDDLEDDECLFGGRGAMCSSGGAPSVRQKSPPGRFKVPFGREELISFSDTDFAYRALVSTTIPPARDKGAMVNGRFLRRGVTYEVGVFDDDGDNGRLTEPQFAVGGDPEDIGPSFAASGDRYAVPAAEREPRDLSSRLRIRYGRCTGGAQ